MITLRRAIFLGIIPFASALPASPPTVTLSSPDAKITGSSFVVETFNGIPFAQPPTGRLRLKPPQRLNSSLGEITATGLAPACPQFFLSVDKSQFPLNYLGEAINLPIFQSILGAKEDCLTVSVQRPKGTKPGDRLPVLFWIFGGAYQLGGTQMYDATSLVKESVDNGQPIIFVAVNYRLGAFGFLPGAEVLEDGSANLGLLDQRLALQWVADNIEVFGGDPDRVTIWGESAGSFSVLNQMLLYEGDNSYNEKPLFHGAIMNSGSLVPADPVSSAKAQDVYDTVVKSAGCSSAQNTLECLRGVDYDTFLRASNSVPGIASYHATAFFYLPRPDGNTLTDSGEVLVRQGKYAKVPFIVGDMEDEGTLFALFQPNITSTEDIVQYLSTIYFPNADREVISEWVGTYPDDPSKGSPYRTGPFYNWYPQYKRMASLLGDYVITLSRRVFLTAVQENDPDLPFWSFIGTWNHGTPFLGTFHASDLVQIFYGILPNFARKSTRKYYFSFVHNQDPNRGAGLPLWPRWAEGKQLMNFLDNRVELLKDTFRSESFDFLLENIRKLRL